MVETNGSGWTPARRTVLRSAAVAAVTGGGLSILTGEAAALDCSVVVDDSGGADYVSIQDAIDDASDGDAICVRAGTYVEDVSVDKRVTVAGADDPGGSAAAVVDGSVEISASGATVRRLKVAPTGTYTPDGVDPYGILVTGTVQDVTVRENVVAGIEADSDGGGGSITINGIQVWNDGDDLLTGTVLRDNVVRDLHNEGGDEWPDYGGAAAIKVQGVVRGTAVVKNTIESIHSAGWTYGVVTTHTSNAPGTSPLQTTVRGNTIREVNDGSVYDVRTDPESAPYPGSAFAIDGDSRASAATVNYNNFQRTPIGAQNKDDTSQLDAECNYWGHATGPEADDNPRGRGAKVTGDVDYRPWSRHRICPERHRETDCRGGSDQDQGQGQV